MNKNLLYFFLFFATILSYSQIKDTTWLKEVKILTTSNKVEHLKTKGTLSSLAGNPIKGIISKVDDIPDGKLSSIKFFFNRSSIFFLKDSDRANYKDVELGFLIYDVKEDGTPGELLIDRVIIFSLNAQNNGFIELDLKPLILDTSKTMFFGLELLNKQLGKDFKIMTKCNNKNFNLLYVKIWNSENWHPSDMPCKMKLDIGIAVRK